MPLLKLTPYARCTDIVLYAIQGECTCHPHFASWYMLRHRARLSRCVKYIAKHLAKGDRYLAGQAYIALRSM